MSIRYRSKFRLLLPASWSTNNNTDCETRIFHSEQLTVIESLYEIPDDTGRMCMHIRIMAPQRPTRNQVDTVLAQFVGAMYLNALTFEQKFASNVDSRAEDLWMTFLSSDVVAFINRGRETVTV